MEKSILRNTLATTFAFSILLAGNASANMLVNGDFESEPNWGSSNGTGCGAYDGNCSALTGSQLPGWTIETGHAVTIHNTSYPTISGSYSVNTDGEGYNHHNANFYQDFASTAGQQLDLKYDWQTWYGTTSPANNLFVSVTDTVTGATLYTGDLAYQQGLHHEDALFAGTGDVLRLRIEERQETGINDNLYIVDNFSVTALAAPVPEPETYAMMMAGLGLLGFMARRKKQQA